MRYKGTLGDVIQSVARRYVTIVNLEYRPTVKMLFNRAV
jgi:hypothetical protein